MGQVRNSQPPELRKPKSWFVSEWGHSVWILEIRLTQQSRASHQEGLLGRHHDLSRGRAFRGGARAEERRTLWPESVALNIDTEENQPHWDVTISGQVPDCGSPAQEDLPGAASLLARGSRAPAYAFATADPPARRQASASWSALLGVFPVKIP